jgi:hypothetical protein
VSAALGQRLEAMNLTQQGRPLGLAVAIGLRLDSKANAQVGQSFKARMAKARLVQYQRADGASLGAVLRPGFLGARAGALWFAILLTRFGPRPLDDDNLDAAFKHVRDGLARKLGVDDGDSTVRYVVDQERGPYSVRAQLFARWK